jgi:hypothetical protein
MQDVLEQEKARVLQHQEGASRAAASDDELDAELSDDEFDAELEDLKKRVRQLQDEMVRQKRPTSQQQELQSLSPLIRLCTQCLQVDHETDFLRKPVLLLLGAQERLEHLLLQVEPPGTECQSGEDDAGDGTQLEKLKKRVWRKGEDERLAKRPSHAVVAEDGLPAVDQSAADLQEVMQHAVAIRPHGGLEVPLCTFFAMGTCSMGMDCAFAHEVSTELPKLPPGFQYEEDEDAEMDCAFAHVSTELPKLPPGFEYEEDEDAEMVFLQQHPDPAPLWTAGYLLEQFGLIQNSLFPWLGEPEVNICAVRMNFLLQLSWVKSCCSDNSSQDTMSPWVLTAAYKGLASAQFLIGNAQALQEGRHLTDMTSAWLIRAASQATRRFVWIVRTPPLTPPFLQGCHPNAMACVESLYRPCENLSEVLRYLVLARRIDGDGGQYHRSYQRVLNWDARASYLGYFYSPGPARTRKWLTDLYRIGLWISRYFHLFAHYDGDKRLFLTLFERRCTGAQQAVLCWMWIARLQRMPRDVALIIARDVWESRLDPRPGRWNDPNGV